MGVIMESGINMMVILVTPSMRTNWSLIEEVEEVKEEDSVKKVENLVRNHVNHVNHVKKKLNDDADAEPVSLVNKYEMNYI